MSKRSAVIIPARYNSARLPGKVLLMLGDKPVVQHVYEKAVAADVGSVYIATDSEKVFKVCERFAQVIMTQEHASGTDRVAEAAQTLEPETIINIQGDEPFIDINLIKALHQNLIQGAPWVSAAHPIKSLDELTNKNAVKVVLDRRGNALYFSRSPIPLYRDSPETLNPALRHIGVYGYHRKTLQTLAALPPCRIEQIEKLEQLRGLNAGLKIKIIATEEPSQGIDTIEDFWQASKIIGQAS